MIALSDKRKHELSLTLLFAAFHFLWVTVLVPTTRAGEGWLSTRQMEMVYYTQQLVLISGMLAYAGLSGLAENGRFRRSCSPAAGALFFIGVAVLLTADKGTPFYLAVSAAVSLCLGALLAAVYRRMSLETAAGAATARCLGCGSALAIALQYLLQSRWGQSPLLPVGMLAAFGWVAYMLLSSPVEAPASDENAAPGTVRGVRLLIPCLVSVLFLFFIDCYNEHIVYLYTQSGFTANDPYQWPRLAVIPCYLLFAAIGDKRDGRLVPVASLCIALTATLNSVLAGYRGAYWVNMCLFYCAVAATINYYTLVFWRLAPRTRRPALWASMGRILDCVMVLVTGGVRLGTLPPAVILGMDIAGVALIILMMALGGDLNLSTSTAMEAPPAPAEAPPAPLPPAELSPEETLERMRDRYDLTRREAEVLRELVLTEDKQSVISERLSIQVKTLQDYVTRLYRKTGAATRAGLTDLYHENRRQL